MRKILGLSLFWFTLAVHCNGQSKPMPYIESPGLTHWGKVGNDTAVYMIQKDPYRPKETRMVWVNKKQVAGYKIRLYSVAKRDSILGQ